MIKRWTATLSNGISAVIQPEGAVGFRLLIHRDGKGGVDYIQDTLEIAMEQAEEEFGVPRSAWNFDVSGE